MATKALTERQAQAAIKKTQSAVIVWARIVGLATITNDASVDLPAARAQLLAAAVSLSHADITLRAVARPAVVAREATEALARVRAARLAGNPAPGSLAARHVEEDRRADARARAFHGG